MKWKAILYLCLSFSTLSADLQITSSIAEKVGQKIWQNECKGTFEGLTSWNQGEEFASMGIGHFIWYPEGKKTFKEMFPELLSFLEKNGVKLPPWLQENQTCPWHSKKEFQEDFYSEKMEKLRTFLFDTRGLQALFMAKRLEKSLTAMKEGLGQGDKELLIFRFNALASDPHGLYPLLDYVNFKGEGISPSENYKGEGWGLKQVLLNMSENGENIVHNFAQSAKAILIKRMENSPPARNEQRWLRGWLNRIDTYLLDIP